MNQNYNLIATIYCKHNYFKDRVFKTIGFTIEEDSIKLMKDLGIVFKYFSGGFHLLSSNIDLLGSENEEKSLKIYLSCNDPYYINYTDVGNAYNPITDIFYFNNKGIPADNDNLHAEEFVGLHDIVLVNSVKHDGVWRKPMAIIEIFTKTLYDYFMMAEEKMDYTIHFNNTYTKWKYFLTSPIYQKFSDLKIIQKENGIAFKKAAKTQIQDNNNIIIIESENEIPLLEYSKDTYQLKGYDTTSRSNKLIIENLVHASPEQLYFETPKNIENNQNSEAATSNKKIIYSHIYI